MKKLLVLTLAWILLLSAAVSGTAQETEQELTWAAAEEILTHISDPVFPDYEVSVLDFGAKADGITLDTQAFADAIEHVHNAGGGTVNVPSGTYLTGAITLLSNVELHLADEDTVIRFTDEINEENYPLALVHWEASECYNYRSMIYAHEATNIAVTGPGLLDGQADEDTWYNWTKSNNETTKQSRLDLMEMNVNQVPVEERVFGDGSMLRNNMIQLVGCENVLLEGFTIHNSPMWQVNPVLCTNITVRGLVIDSTGPNNDGCNPESCNYVLIEDCSFNTGDDCIAIKSGRDEDGHRLNTPCQNIVVRNCEFVGGGGCITVGSEMSGGVSNVFVTDCELTSTSLDFAFRFKTNKQRGGYVENLYIRNIDVVGGVSNATLHATMLYEEGPNGPYLPVFKNFVIENVTSRGGDYGLFLESFEEVPITGIVLRNLTIEDTGIAMRAMNWQDPVLENVVINGLEYPRPTETRVIGIPYAGETLTASTLYLGGQLEDISYSWLASDAVDGVFTQVAEGETLDVTEDLTGKYIKLVATDPNGRTNESAVYAVLESLPAQDSPYAEDAARIQAKRYIDVNSLDMDAVVTRMDMARIIAAMWEVEPIETELVFTDVDPQDNGLCAALVESGLMASSGVPRGVTSGEVTFLADEKVTKEQLAALVMSSCGVSYKQAMSGTPVYNDVESIDSTYYGDLTRAQYFGFFPADENGNFNPKEEVTFGYALHIMEMVSNFAGK